jgi:hypothetical protein
VAWTAPRTWVTSELVTSAILNTHVRDNLKELWRVIETIPHSGGSSGPGNASIYGTAVNPIVGLTTRTYPGYPIEIRFQTAYIYETVTTDGGWVLGIDDTTVNVATTAQILGQGWNTQQGGGLYSHRITPSAASHTYKISLWSQNGTGADVAACGPGSLVLLERGG